MPLVFNAAGRACPNIFVVNDVGMFGRDFDIAMSESSGAFACPV